MKNEGLMRAIGALDDDLVTEALEPLPRQKRKPAVYLRCLMAAACLALVVLGAASIFSQETALELSVDGTVLEQNVPAELSLHTAARQGSAEQKELTVHISGSGGAWLLHCGEGSGLWDSDGQLCSSLTVAGETEISWILDLSDRESFTLSVQGNEETLLLTAILTQNGEGLLLTVTPQSE